MRYAIVYTDTFRHFDVIDEVIFEYKNAPEQLLINITNNLKNPEQTALISLNYLNEEQFELAIPHILKIKQEHPNMKIIIDFREHKKYISILQEKEIDFFFSDFARNLTMLAAMKRLGASEAYIAEDLGFYLHKLQKFRDNKFKFRVWPDIAQTISGTKDVFHSLTQFFIRPEDITFYEDFIDTVEFMRLGTKVNTIYEIYQQGQWLGNLDMIILDLETSIDNKTITPYFGKQRSHCEKRCLWSACDICGRTQELGEALEKNDIAIINKRKPKKIPENILNLKGDMDGSKSNEKPLFKDSSSIKENID